MRTVSAMLALVGALGIVSPAVAGTVGKPSRNGCAPYLMDGQARVVMKTPVKVVADVKLEPQLVTCAWGAASKSGRTMAMNVNINVIDPATKVGRAGRDELAATYCTYIEDTCDYLGTLKRATTPDGVLLGIARIYQRLGGTVRDLNLAPGLRAIAAAAPPALQGNVFMIRRGTLISVQCINVRSFTIDMGCSTHALKVIAANVGP